MIRGDAGSLAKMKQVPAVVLANLPQLGLSRNTFARLHLGIQCHDVGTIGQHFAAYRIRSTYKSICMWRVHLVLILLPTTRPRHIAARFGPFGASSSSSRFIILTLVSFLIPSASGVVAVSLSFARSATLLS